MPIYTANQPLYFPAVYMLNRYRWCKDVVIMQEAQFSKFSQHSRAYINTKQGQSYLILPLRDKNFKPLNEVEVDQPSKWFDKLQKTLQTVYGKCDGYKLYGTHLLEWLDEVVKGSEAACTQLTQEVLCSSILRWAVMTLDLPCRLHDSLELIPKRPADASEWIADFGAVLGDDIYLGGQVAMEAYVKQDVFASRGVTCIAQKYVMPPYRGLSGEMVTNGNVCLLDPLFVGGVPLLLSLIEVGYAVREA